MKSIVLSERSNGEPGSVEALGVKLNPQLRRFAYEYLVDFNHRKAASRVSLNPDKAMATLRNPDVRAYIDALNEYICQDSLIPKALVETEILDFALPVSKGEMAAHTVVPGIGVMNVKVMREAMYMRTLEMASKHTGFTESERESGAVTININSAALGVEINGS